MKRSFDLILSIALLLLFLPVLLAVAALVRIRLGSPVFFRQERPGRGMKPFRMYKFRTMTNGTDEGGKLLPDELRLTAFGLLLRRLSLDEFPQLFNVVKGEMSLVGPRPLLMRYLPYFTEWERKRFEVRPGITGLAQVSGRNYLAWAERFALDVNYVEERSFVLDLKIMRATVVKVFKSKDVMDVPTLQLQDLDIERGM